MAEKSLDEIKADILNRAGRVNPFERVKREDVEQVLQRLDSLDPDLWGREWEKFGAKYEALGEEQKKKEKRKKPERLSIWRMSTTVLAVIPSQAARKR